VVGSKLKQEPAKQPEEDQAIRESQEEILLEATEEDV